VEQRVDLDVREAEEPADLGGERRLAGSEVPATSTRCGGPAGGRWRGAPARL
jgi:hypothetical protein